MPYWFDGNNLIGLSAAAARQDRKTRRSFLELLSGYVQVRGGRFTAFFDGDGTNRIMPPRGVRVRYSAPLSTDDAILHQLKGSAAPEEIIVVTNDHALFGRCRDAGAKTMDWREFTARMNRSSRNPASHSSRDEKVDVDEWSRFFGIDPEKL
jgi:predicted RNA-binding protein with PIN domain